MTFVARGTCPGCGRRVRGVLCTNARVQIAYDGRAHATRFVPCVCGSYRAPETLHLRERLRGWRLLRKLARARRKAIAKLGDDW